MLILRYWQKDLVIKLYIFQVEVSPLHHMALPDLGITSMEDVLTDVKRITNASSLPLLVDIDTGWGGAFNISRTIKSMIDAGCGCCSYGRSSFSKEMRT